MMVVHSPAGPILETDIKLALAIGASLVEILPRWNNLPPANEIAGKVKDAGLSIWTYLFVVDTIATTTPT